ncbi:MAG: 1-deoxy-D-xylulose-5-phosphate reductoisomerase, partial [Desulfonatronovibrio sp. MSAO_Bac4]
MSYISPTDSPHFKAKKRTITILGSTGSIGTSSLNVIRHNRDDFQVVGLAGARNIELLAEQANEFRPGVLGVYNESLAGELSSRLDSGYCPDIVYGTSGYENMAMMDDADFIMSAMVGAAGLRPTMAAAQKGKVILLANKESLVLAGDLIGETCNKYQSVILPVDSEHNALFQAMQGHEFKGVESIIITASGGPFRGRDKAFMSKVTPEQALDHPNWSMGAKISIDSATMMNKGLEVIEACHLFGIST